MNEDIRSQLIRQFPVDVIETKGEMGSTYYTCPCCGRSLARGMDKCNSCDQILNWEHVDQHEEERGLKKAIIEFEVPFDFKPGDCRKCPVSYIGKSGDDRVYECPINMRGVCRLKIVDGK